MTSGTTTNTQTQVEIKINYAGREHPFHTPDGELILALRTAAMDFFNIVADRDRLRLYRLDNTELNDQAPIGSYSLAKHEVLILRQPQGGGTGC